MKGPRSQGKPKRSTRVEAEPLWFKDAIVYQVHVRAFYDSANDGVGDFRGLAQKLDYVRDLGVTAVWLLPFYPSPLKDDGYDIADYTDVHPLYGNLADFRHFLKEAHQRGLRVITELVLNHTSDRHPWFQRARRAPAGSSARDFYVWSDDAERFKEARIIFKDFEASNWSWDPVAGAYYWHRFYSHQPDLNYQNPAVRRAVYRAMDFWLEMGVDGLRLDAVPYLHEREGTSCENLPETHAELKALRRHVDQGFDDRMLLAEANQWPEDAVAYLGQGDECHMAFHFPLMPRMFMALRMEDRYPIIDILNQTPSIPDSCQWALFLRNHDELTLEMVTDEERDYMYRVYARDPQARINLGIRRRLAPLLGNDRRRIELMNGLLFSLPGTPIVYYGDEIGMGDNIHLGDRNGVRTPMQWSADRNAGFSRANPQRLYLPVVIDPGFSYEAVNVEEQHDNPHSLLWWMRRLTALRKGYKAFGRGSLEFLFPENRRVLAFVRRHQDECLLVVANLSRYTQFVELDLSAYAGRVPVELFGRSSFPAVAATPYPLTLSPHSFYWFSLEAPAVPEAAGASRGGPRRIPVRGAWQSVFRGRACAELESALPGFLAGRRWFGGKSRRVKGVALRDHVPLNAEGAGVELVLLQVEYTEGDPESYAMLLGHATGEAAAALRPETLVAPLAVDGQEGALYEASGARGPALGLLMAMARRRRMRGGAGEIVGSHTRFLRQRLQPLAALPEPSLLSAEQSNTSIRFGDSLVLKLFRHAEEGQNPDLEISLFLTETARFPHVPPVAGFLEYRPAEGEAVTLGLLQGYVPNEGDAWRFSLDAVEHYLDRVLALPPEKRQASVPEGSILAVSEGEIPPLAQDLVGTYLENARLLGVRCAELHLALVSKPEDPAFAPEPFNPFYRRSLYQSMRNLTESVFERLARRLKDLPPEARAEAEALRGARTEVLRRFRSILDRNITALRTRHHGDFHLGQVLWTGRDFVIFDFEGEPARPISTRRIKRSPLRDVAGMIRSFHYAAFHGLSSLQGAGRVRAEELGEFVPWVGFWHAWVSSAFLRSYLRTAGDAAFLPRSREELDGLLTVYLLEKAVYELGYELDNRPDWVRLPLRGILQLLEA